MIEKIRRVLELDCLIDPARPLVVGVSGGPDSLCLLDILHRLHYFIIPAHLDHRIRPESANEAEQVEKIAAAMGLKLASAVEDVPLYARRSHLSIEEAAREKRYGFLFSVARQHNAQGVATAHTADDQVETVWLHLLRGSGLKGLIGMEYRTPKHPWDPSIPLVRPLLGVWRSEIEEYLVENGLTAIEDLSNLDIQYRRNRIRRELLPSLQSYNPQIKKAFWKLSRLLSADEDFLQDAMLQTWDQCIAWATKNAIGIRRNSFLATHLALQRRLLQHACLTLTQDRFDGGYETIERARFSIEQEKRQGPYDLANGLILAIEDDIAWLTVNLSKLPNINWPQMPENEPICLPIPGIVELSKGWALESSWLDAGDLLKDPRLLDNILHNRDPYQAWLDLREVKLPLRLRPRRPGDRFHPLGMAGRSQKISDFMINHHMPARARNAWPLVTADRTELFGAGQAELILWVCGVQISEQARIQPDSRTMVQLRLIRPTYSDPIQRSY